MLICNASLKTLKRFSWQFWKLYFYYKTYQLIILLVSEKIIFSDCDSLLNAYKKSRNKYSVGNILDLICNILPKDSKNIWSILFLALNLKKNVLRKFKDDGPRWLSIPCDVEINIWARFGWANFFSIFWMKIIMFAELIIYTQKLWMIHWCLINLDSAL